ncbi:MAG: PQQ-binding-like beta-propeller repeat protein [Kiritimatiellae bacterium]|nr:PQQ-binding-like beta-propeller repeat protein [Kiritimatiellia bacterium]
MPHSTPFRNLAGALFTLTALSAQAGEWTHRTAHNFALPVSEEIRLTDRVHLVRPAWEYAVHTGIGKGGSGTAIDVLDQGFEPTFGDTASTLVADGVYLVSWSEATGDVVARPESITDRYYRGEENYEALAETYFRIDANWNTLALDADTGKKLWRVSEPSASMNFVSSKRGHNGIDPAAGNGVYVTATVTGRIFAYDIRTGEKRWEGDVGEWHERAEAFKAEALAERNIPGVGDGMFGYLRPGLVVVDGVAVVPDLREGLIGFDVATGEERWRIQESVNNRQGSPRLWTHEGKSYLLTHQNRRENAVYLIDPADGTLVWKAETGYNPGDLIMGEGMVMLNPDSNRRNPALLAAYRITLDGLEKQWRFEDEDRNRVPVLPDRGAERKGVMDDGRLYIAIGHPHRDRHMAVFDLAGGEELWRGDDRVSNNVGLPVSKGDKLYWQVDSAHSGESGIFVYQKHEDGRIENLGEVNYRSLGVRFLIDYEYTIETPYVNGFLFLRGRTNLMAVDLREPMIPPARVQLDGAWGGYIHPVHAVWVANADREIELGRVEVPIRRELGVPGTTARRIDVWDRFEFDEPLKLGEAWDTNATLHMAAFSWPARIVMAEAEGNEWRGQWTRHFPGWAETLTLDGTLHESSEGGYTRRGWPTGWLEDQPVTFFSDLEDGQARVILQVHGALPLQDGGRRNVTICLDHDGEKIVSAVAGGFSFNQSYHEVDASGLTVTPEGLSGAARVILNGDPWMQNPDWKNGGSLMGLLTLHVQFGDANDEGVYPVSGDWSIEWGVSGERTGNISATQNK